MSSSNQFGDDLLVSNDLGVKGTTVGTIIIAQVPWSLCANGTTEQE